MTKKKNDNTIAINKKANYEYETIEKFIAGVVLQGWQVKSLRNKRVSLANSPHIIIDRNNEAWISGMTITPMEQANTHNNHDANQSIKLLLNKNEINKIRGSKEQKGYTAILHSLFWQGQYVKANISLSRGKNTVDKRKTVQEREGKIEAQRAMKNIRL